MRNKWWAKLLRVVGIIFMSLTAAFTLMGGAGTTCVALNPLGYDGKFSGIAPFQWLYIFFVLATVAIGVMGVRAVVLLIKGRRNAYRYSMIALIAGLVIGGIHMAVSRALRGGSMPVDGVVYVTVLTLVLFLIFRIPGIWQGVNYEKPTDENPTGKNASALALILCGFLTLTIQYLMAPTHTINGVNYADAWHVTLTIIGIGLIFAGLASVLWKRVKVAQQESIVAPR